MILRTSGNIKHPFDFIVFILEISRSYFFDLPEYSVKICRVGKTTSVSCLTDGKRSGGQQDFSVIYSILVEQLRVSHIEKLFDKMPGAGS